jgi:hypothetical protein
MRTGEKGFQINTFLLERLSGDQKFIRNMPYCVYAKPSVRKVLTWNSPSSLRFQMNAERDTDLEG